MNPAAPSQSSLVLDDETAMRHQQELVRSLALSIAILFRDGNKIGASATIEKMLDVYTIQMRAPHSQHWTSLPSLGAMQKLMVDKFANADGISGRQAAEFGRCRRLEDASGLREPNSAPQGNQY